MFVGSIIFVPMGGGNRHHEGRVVVAVFWEVRTQKKIKNGIKVCKKEKLSVEIVKKKKTLKEENKQARGHGKSVLRKKVLEIWGASDFHFFVTHSAENLMPPTWRACHYSSLTVVS